MGAEAIPGRRHFGTGAGTFARNLDLTAGNRMPFASRRQRGPHKPVVPVIYIIRALP